MKQINKHIVVKQLNTYIIEKLKINKDSKLDNIDYISDIIDIFHVEFNEKAENCFIQWLNDYDKTLWCYFNELEYRYVKKGRINKISLNPSDAITMKQAEDIADQANVYKANDAFITEIKLSQFALAIYIKHKTWPIVFEKSKY